MESKPYGSFEPPASTNYPHPNDFDPSGPIARDQHGWVYNHRHEIAAFSLTIIIKIIWRMITKTINAIIRQIKWYIRIADWAFWIGRKLFGWFIGANPEPVIPPAPSIPVEPKI